jgi:DNA-binding response OmpR family regulator
VSTTGPDPTDAPRWGSAGATFAPLDAPAIVAGPVTILLEQYAVLINHRRLPLLPLAQFRLLTTLAANAGRALSYAELAAAAWPDRLHPQPKRRLEKLVAALREHLGSDVAPLLRNIRGLGYVLDRELVAKPHRIQGGHLE